MNRFTKISLTLASTGGALMFTAAPMAFASAVPSVNLAAAGSYQVQNGTDSYGSTLDQNSSVSAGGVTATNYYNSTTDNGYKQTQTTFTNQNGYMVGNNEEYGQNNPTANSQDKTTNYGSSSWTNATSYASLGAGTNLNQSQNVDNFGEGGHQFGVSGAIAGTANSSGITGGVALNIQKQNGDDAYGTTLNQASSAQAGLLNASGYQYDNNNYGYKESTTTWNNGSKTSSVDTNNYGGSSYTSADEYLNPFASSSQDSAQNVSDYGSGGVQKQGQLAVAGQAGNFLSLAAKGQQKNGNGSFK